jgi:aryl-alcohol dehydrogenase-like predicted oxidoreductase
MIDLAMGFVLAHPMVTSAIVGPRTMEHLKGQIRAAEMKLDDDLLDEIDAVVPPGTNVNPAESGFQPASITQSARRRHRFIT